MINKELLISLSPILSFTLNVFSQLSASRLTKKISMLKSVVFGFVASLILQSLIIVKFDVDIILSLNHFITLICLGYCYFSFLGLVDSARRPLMLRKIIKSGGRIKRDDLISNLQNECMLKFRLDRLVKKGQLKLKDGRFTIAGKLVLSLSKAVLFARLIVFGTSQLRDCKQ